MFKKIASAAVLAVLANSTYAAEITQFYIGADAGTSKLDDYSDRETSYGAFGGVEFNQYFAIEGGYRRFSRFDVAPAKLRVSQAAISGIGSLPLGSGFSLFARLGYNRLTAKASYMGYSADESTSGGLVGLGAAYAFSPQVAARIELQRPSSDSTNLSAGILVKF